MAADVLRTLGAEVSAIHDQPDGVNINAHCGSTCLAALSEAVRAGDYDLGVATALGFVTSVLSMFGVVAFVAAAVYLVDVRPALAQVSGRGGGRQGPYGPW